MGNMRDQFNSLFVDTSTATWLRNKKEVSNLRKEIRERFSNDPLDSTVDDLRNILNVLINKINEAELRSGVLFESYSSDGSNTPRASTTNSPIASGSNVLLPEAENPFNDLPRPFNGTSITTSQEQADYFNSSTSIKNDSIRLSGFNEIDE